MKVNVPFTCGSCIYSSLYNTSSFCNVQSSYAVVSDWGGNLCLFLILVLIICSFYIVQFANNVPVTSSSLVTVLYISVLIYDIVG